jgi:hypothetical protein
VSPPRFVTHIVGNRKNGLDFTPMDDFMSQILEAIGEHGARAVRIFPPGAQVLIAFADRLATDVVRRAPSILISSTFNEIAGRRLHHRSIRKSQRSIDCHVSASERCLF